MKLNQKVIFLMSFVFIANILFKGLNIGTSPNSISLTGTFSEIDLLRKLHYFPALGNYSFRYLSVIISTLISLISFYGIYRKTKNIWLGFSCGMILAVSPWIVVLSRFLNIYVFFLALLIIPVLFLPGKIKYLFILSGILIFKFVSAGYYFLWQFNMADFLKLIDFRTLFFNGDSTSLFLNIPFTGFFLYIDIVLLIIGCYYVFTKKELSGLRKIVSLTFIAGVFYFFILPKDLIYTYRGLLLFYSASIVIGTGYYYLLKYLKNKKILLLIFMTIAVVNLLFYLELFYKHFDKKNSFEWGYAEESAVKYLFNNKLSKQVYVTDEAAGKLNRYLTFFSHDKFVAPIISGDKLSKTCLKNSVSICIIREQDLSLLHLEKDDVKIQFRHFDGLPMYFLIPNP